MTSKEKAEELFKKMNGFRTSYAHRVKCAKVVCDELIAFTVSDLVKEYYETVKLELEKLKEKKS